MAKFSYLWMIAPLCGSSRFAFAMVSFAGCACLLLMRINMNVAVVCMSRDPEPSSPLSLSNETEGHWHSFHWVEDNSTELSGCYDVLENSIDEGEFEWDRTLRGYINSSFYVGYLMTQLFGGWLSVRYGGKWVTFGGMLVTTAATMLSPIAAQTNVYLLILMRIVNGMGSGLFFPASNQMWGSWAPVYERSFLLAFVTSGISGGSILSFFVSGIICGSIGWEWVFYTYGIATVVWFIFWVFFAYESPSDHPRVTELERVYINSSTLQFEEDEDGADAGAPWGEILKSPCVWAIAIADFCHSWGTYTALTSITQYMKDVLKFEIKKNGLFTSLPYICQWFATITFSLIVDYVQRKKIASITVARKIGGAVACFPPAVLLIGLSFLDCDDAMIAVVILCLVEFFGCANRVSILPNRVDIAPKYAGVIVGLSNTASTIPGIISPSIVGMLTPNGSQSEWQIVFIICACSYVVGGATFAVLGSGDVQPWAMQDPEIHILRSNLPSTKKYSGGVDNEGYAGSEPTDQAEMDDKLGDLVDMESRKYRRKSRRMSSSLYPDF